MKNFLIILLLFSVFSSNSQTSFADSIYSNLLQEKRAIQVYLPRSYTTKPDKSYPLILTFDGEYMFYSILGASKILQFNDEMPEVIVVGINQNYLDKSHLKVRNNDCKYDLSGSLTDSGIKFKKFVLQELLPKLKEKYRINSFNTLCGHSFTANYIHYFLFEKDNPFQAFIAISPLVPKANEKKILKAIDKNENDLFYYISTGSKDFRLHTKSVLSINSNVFDKVFNSKLKYKMDNFNNESHLSLVHKSFPYALRHVFSIYAPIRKKDVSFQKNILNYIQLKYDFIKRVYKVDKKMRQWDLSMAAEVAIKNKEWNDLNSLADRFILLYPKIAYGYAIKGYYYKQIGDKVKALNVYKEALQYAVGFTDKTEYANIVKALQENK